MWKPVSKLPDIYSTDTGVRIGPRLHGGEDHAEALAKAVRPYRTNATFFTAVVRPDRVRRTK